MTLSGVSLPVVSVAKGGKSFTDPGEREWKLVKGEKALAEPKEGEEPAPLKGTTVWSKDVPDQLQLTDDAGRTWELVLPKKEEKKEKPKK